MGIQLTQRILTQLEPGWEMHSDLVAAGFNTDVLENFRYQFQRSGQYSIDAFLQHRGDQYDVGRATIAWQIISGERHSNLYSVEIRQDWYRFLVQKMNGPLKRFGDNNVAFITFNYDRSLEYYLVQHLAGAYGLADEYAADVVSNFPMIHLHGEVGEVSPPGAGGRPYSPEINLSEFEQWWHRIHIVHDELGEREARFTEAKQLLASASRVIFLGFGFDETNTSRLQVNNISAPAIGTCLGMNEIQKSRVIQSCASRVILTNMDCYALLSEHDILN